MQKARRHPIRAPTACKRMVSGSISLLYSRFFSPFPHGTGSLSVSQQYLALPDGPGRFMQGFSCPALLRILLLYLYLSLTGLSPSMGILSKIFRFNTNKDVVVLLPQYCRNSTGLGCFTFARRYQQNHYCFLFLRLIRCFSSPGSPPCGYYTFSIVGCPIRISADHLICANPRSFSQLVTSFIASESLGIPHTPLISLSVSIIIQFFSYSLVFLYISICQ